MQIATRVEYISLMLVMVYETLNEPVNISNVMTLYMNKAFMNLNVMYKTDV